MMKNKNYFFRVIRSCVLLFFSQQCEAIMPGRGKTSPWWTHFQQVEGCVEIILLFLIWIVQVTFDLQNACIVTRWCEEGKLAAVHGKRPIQAGFHTWGLSMVVLLSRWCSLSKFLPAMFIAFQVQRQVEAGKASKVDIDLKDETCGQNSFSRRIF